MDALDAKTEPKKKIKNVNYRRFLDTGIIDLIGRDRLIQILDNVQHRSQLQARALVICMYITGARPIEIMNIKSNDFYQQGQDLFINMPASKRGKPRILIYPMMDELVKELWDYVARFPPEAYPFFMFKSQNIALNKTKRGFNRIVRRSTRLLYWVKKWSANLDIGSITPYYFRHNNFTILANEGANEKTLMYCKGARDSASISYYIHGTIEEARKAGQMLRRGSKNANKISDG